MPLRRCPDRQAFAVIYARYKCAPASICLPNFGQDSKVYFAITIWQLSQRCMTWSGIEIAANLQTRSSMRCPINFCVSYILFQSFFCWFKNFQSFDFLFWGRGEACSRNNFVGNLLTVCYVCLTCFIASFIKRPIDKNAFIFRLNAFLQITTHSPSLAILLALVCLLPRLPAIDAVRGGAAVVVADDDDDETMEYAPQFVSAPNWSTF